MDNEFNYVNVHIFNLLEIANAISNRFSHSTSLTVSADCQKTQDALSLFHLIFHLIMLLTPTLNSVQRLFRPLQNFGHKHTQYKMSNITTIKSPKMQNSNYKR